jgi:hypothetical protein
LTEFLHSDYDDVQEWVTLPHIHNNLSVDQKQLLEHYGINVSDEDPFTVTVTPEESIRSYGGSSIGTGSAYPSGGPRSNTHSRAKYGKRSNRERNNINESVVTGLIGSSSAATGSMIGMFIGAGGGPVGVIAGGAIGAAIGGIVGTAVSVIGHQQR